MNENIQKREIALKEAKMMQGFPNKQTIERLRKKYPKGTRVELVSMNP